SYPTPESWSFTWKCSSCTELLVRFKSSSFWYTINTGSSAKLLLDVLLVPRAMEILWLWFHRTSPFICSSRS
ncbi:hypothetical protein STEG23_022572, partial [Scotinomys teguina]